MEICLRQGARSVKRSIDSIGGYFMDSNKTGASSAIVIDGEVLAAAASDDGDVMKATTAEELAAAKLNYMNAISAQKKLESDLVEAKKAATTAINNLRNAANASGSDAVKNLLNNYINKVNSAKTVDEANSYGNAGVNEINNRVAAEKAEAEKEAEMTFFEKLLNFIQMMIDMIKSLFTF